MCTIFRLLTVAFLALSIPACGSSTPDRFTGPWDIIFLDAQTGQTTRSTIRQHNYLVAYALSGDAKHVITSCRKAVPDPRQRDKRRRDEEPDPTRIGILRVWGAESGRLLAEREDPNTLHSRVWVTPRGTTFLTATADYPARDPLAGPRYILWDYSSGEIRETARFELAPHSNIAAAFSADGQSLVMCGDMFKAELDKADASWKDLANSEVVWVARKWNIGGGKPAATAQVGWGLTTAKDVSQRVARAHISADGSHLVTWPPYSNDRPILAYQLWDLATLERMGEPIALQPEQAPHFLSHDGARIFTTFGSRDDQAVSSYQVLDAASGKPLHPPVTGLRSLQATFAGDGQSVFAMNCPEQGSWRLRLFDSAGGEKWSSGPYQSSRFLTSVVSGDSRIAFAVFPPDERQN
jgi:hypothetical protein